MHRSFAMKVLLTGATGFVGTRLAPRLIADGWSVRRAARHPPPARLGEEWVQLDVDRPETMGPALAGCRAAVYLVHRMAEAADYEVRERAAAVAFGAAALAAGLERIVYLGGVEPSGPPSRHLRSRLETGARLRASGVPTFELRAAMIIGPDSLSFRIVRDLACRLPAMILPRWLSSRSQPIDVSDVVHAIATALELPIELAGAWDLPGPETLTAKEILLRIARSRGMRPLVVDVPVLTPHLSSLWLRLVTSADYKVARELVDGLANDLVARGQSFWDVAPPHALVPFDDAVRRALGAEASTPTSRAVEHAIFRLSRHTA